jgi:methylated-DNA-[protein]-cysteine S-methyltransferase
MVTIEILYKVYFFIAMIRFLCYTFSMIHTCTIDTPLGEMRAAVEDERIAGLWFAGQKHFPPDTAGWIEKKDDPVLKALRLWLKDYFAGKKPPMNLPIAPAGTAFQQAVWKELRKIPYGRTASYGEIAEKLTAKSTASGGRGSPRAVGQAVGRNPVSLLIPCHRVIGGSGSRNRLAGYAGGLDKKRALLELEGSFPLRP